MSLGLNIDQVWETIMAINGMMELVTESAGWKALLKITDQEEERVAKNFNEMLHRHFETIGKENSSEEEAEAPGCLHEVVHWHDDNKYERNVPQTRWSRLRAIWQILGMGQGKDVEAKWTDKEILVFLFACLGHIFKHEVRKAFENEEDEEVADDIINGGEVYFEDLENCVLLLSQRRTRRQLVDTSLANI